MHSHKNIRNIAIIAHVDHGKTTLVDGLLKQSKTFRDNQAEMDQNLIMDSNDQERERGITIKAKITAVNHDEYRINIIDTPGHADFSSEVERTLNMADGCLLMVDAVEGPMPQTTFVLKKALSLGLKPIVVINKIDKPMSRIPEVEDEVANLFLENASHESQLHYPIFYAIGRDGKAWNVVPKDFNEDGNLDILFDAIIKEIPAPTVIDDGPFQMQINELSYDSYKGKYSIGKINRGSIKVGSSVVLTNNNNEKVNAKIDGIFINQGLNKISSEEAFAGDIVSLTGIANSKIGDTICSPNAIEALPPINVEPPTLKMYLGPNTSPFKGQEGQFNTARQIGERLEKELETNVGLLVEPDGIGFLVSGRGELHLSVLIEGMRREGYEFEVGRPQVVTKVEDGKVLEPIEELIIEAPAEHVGSVQQELGLRRAIPKNQTQTSSGTKMTFQLPTRSLLGLRNILLTATKGTAIMNSQMIGYEPLGSALPQLRNGALISFETGVSTPYALEYAQERGTLFIGPGSKIYSGQIIGLNIRQEDLEVNVCKAKQLTNIRSSASDGTVQLTPFTNLSLEQCLDFIENDELLEVTPSNLRLRKRYLDSNERRRNKKS
jgi:GTP-binding protein